MACEILIYRNPRNYSHPDIEKDKRSVYKKGYIVGGKTLPHTGWGNKEVFSAGNFVHVKIKDATWEELKDYAETWNINIEYTKLGEDLSIDGHRFKVYTTNPGVSGKGNLTRNKIENYLNKWNVTIHSIDINEVVIDLTINNLLKSRAYWGSVPGDGLGDLIYSQINYDEVSGEHVYNLDYSAVKSDITNRSIVANKLSKRLGKRGVTFSNHDTVNQTANATIFRNTVLTYFRDEVKNDVANSSILYKRQYYIDIPNVNYLVYYSTHHGGDPYEITKAQLQTSIKSMSDEVNA